MIKNRRITAAAVLVLVVALCTAVAYDAGFQSGVSTGFQMGREGIEKEAVRHGLAHWTGQFPPHELEWINVHPRWAGADGVDSRD